MTECTYDYAFYELDRDDYASSYDLDSEDLNTYELESTKNDPYMIVELLQPTGIFFYPVFYNCILGAMHF